MQLEITGHHIDITAPLSNHINKRISRLKRHFDQVLDIHVILKVKKLDHTAEAILHFRGNRVFAEAKSHDMYIAIDQLADKLERQVLKHKEKTKSHHSSEGEHRNIQYTA
ncbi:MAG: ribosome-associated translation inhibitor RaiA [Thiotrichaceae bacterium]|nr:ribosome-associated translation inhibitor RaiA [Thiotrichaceae bacterium]